MPHPAVYEEIFYSSHSIKIENLSLTVSLDNGSIEDRVKDTRSHSHPVFEIQASLSGRFLMETPDGDGAVVEKDTLVLIPPEVYHGIRASTPAQRFALRFSMLRAEEAGEDLYGCFGSVQTLTTLENATELISLMHRIREECLHPGAASLSLRKIYLTEFFLLLYRRLSAAKQSALAREPSLSKSDDSHARYNKIEIFINRHLGDPLCEEQLAEALGLSVRQTSRVVKSIFGMSFKKKLLQMRLYHAKGLLTTTQDPVESIATAVGYTSVSGFHIAFKRVFGITPAKYRAKIEKS